MNNMFKLESCFMKPAYEWWVDIAAAQAGKQIRCFHSLTLRGRVGGVSAVLYADVGAGAASVGEHFTPGYLPEFGDTVMATYIQPNARWDWARFELVGGKAVPLPEVLKTIGEVQIPESCLAANIHVDPWMFDVPEEALVRATKKGEFVTNKAGQPIYRLAEEFKWAADSPGWRRDLAKSNRVTEFREFAEIRSAGGRARVTRDMLVG